MYDETGNRKRISSFEVYRNTGGKILKNLARRCNLEYEAKRVWFLFHSKPNVLFFFTYAKSQKTKVESDSNNPIRSSWGVGTKNKF